MKFYLEVGGNTSLEVNHSIMKFDLGVSGNHSNMKFDLGVS